LYHNYTTLWLTNVTSKKIYLRNWITFSNVYRHILLTQHADHQTESVSELKSVWQKIVDTTFWLKRDDVSECKRFNSESRAHSRTHAKQRSAHYSMHVARQIAPHVASVNASTEQRGEQRFQPHVQQFVEQHAS